MHVGLPGSKPPSRMSFVPPVLQFVLVASLFAVAIWAYFAAPHARVTDQWVYNGLSAVAALAGLLFLPFALVALGVVLRNRRSMTR